MEFLKPVQKQIESLDERTFLYWVSGFFGALFFICLLLFYYYYSSIARFKERSRMLNASRTEVRGILERYEMVKKQQAEVDALLAKDKDFKIGGYFNEVVNRFGLEKNKTREPETSRETLDNGYTELKLYASFAQLNMRQVAELLDAIEQNERVYTKEVEMYKQANGQTINVNLLIATVEPKPQELSPTE
jgi:hypothetical protein